MTLHPKLKALLKALVIIVMVTWIFGALVWVFSFMGVPEPTGPQPTKPHTWEQHSVSVNVNDGEPGECLVYITGGDPLLILCRPLGN